MTDLTPRQLREIDYHRAHADANLAKSEIDVNTDVIVSAARRPWNATWSCYDHLLRLGLAGKRFFVPGCGFGDDAIRLCLMGAQVHASDISPDVLDIAARRATRMGVHGLHLETSPIETLPHADDTFDGVFLNDILHHVDIPRAMTEIRRVLKPHGAIIGNELYTHSMIQRIRESALVSKVLYKSMVPFIYGHNKPYITADEHKIDEAEFAVVTGAMRNAGQSIDYFMAIEGRLIPQRWRTVSRLDRTLLKLVGRGAAARLGGRVVFRGMIDK